MSNLPKDMQERIDKILDNLVETSIYHDDLKCATFSRCFKHGQRDKLLYLLEEVDRKARISELDNLIGIYNQQNEPNGEFKPFGKMTKNDVADLYLAVGERIRELEATLKQEPKS
ncbi:MAG TPA: hypothetical protein VNX65_02300 [Patescibacteria group bacterium]|jgi:hypothetical protein|nr:hypothetical protein [Patescibacteria group bacterium]